MPLPLIPLAMGGLSLVTSIFGNAQADENAKLQADQAYRNMGITINNLQNTANELNKQTGMELTDAKFKEMEALASVAGHRVESGIVGNTAKRISDSVEIKGMQFRNQIKQKAEANTIKVQSEMKNAVTNYQSQMLSIATNYENNTDSAFGMLAKAGTAYFTGL